MAYDIAAVSLVLLIGGILFHHFETRTPIWRKVLKFVLTLGVTAVISRYYGHTGVTIMLFVAAVPVIIIHAWWLPSKGINGWTGEPRDKYYALRGWTLPKEPS